MSEPKVTAERSKPVDPAPEGVKQFSDVLRSTQAHSWVDRAIHREIPEATQRHPEVTFVEPRHGHQYFPHVVGGRHFGGGPDHRRLGRTPLGLVVLGAGVPRAHPIDQGARVSRAQEVRTDMARRCSSGP